MVKTDLITWLLTQKHLSKNLIWPDSNLTLICQHNKTRILNLDSSNAQFSILFKFNLVIPDITRTVRSSMKTIIKGKTTKNVLDLLCFFIILMKFNFMIINNYLIWRLNAVLLEVHWGPVGRGPWLRTDGNWRRIFLFINCLNFGLCWFDII